VGGVRVEEPTAVGAELLDRFLRGHRPHRDHLLGPFQGRDFLIRRQVLQHALGDEDEREDEREGQQDVDGGPGEIDPEVADGAVRLPVTVAGEAAGERDRDGDPGGGRDEVVPGEARHLAQVAHRRFADVALPVRVGGEAGGGVEGRAGLHSGELLRVEGQHRLQPLDGVGDQQREQAEGEHGPGVGRPPLFLPVHAREAIDEPLEPSERPGE
jgi:hypothetical protein